MMRMTTRLYPALWLVTLITVGCATRRTRDITPLSERRVDAYARRAHEPHRLLFAVRMDDEGEPVFVDTHRHMTDFTVILPMTERIATPVPMIEARAGARGSRFRALIDTTAPENWTAMDRERQLNLVPVGPPVLETEPVHVTDSFSGVLSAMPELLLDTLRIEAVVFFARATSGPLWPLTRMAAAADADAVLGMPFLRSFAYVQWDYPARTMVFSAAQTYEHDPDAVLAVLPISSLANGIEVIGILGGREHKILLDAAGDFAVAMRDPPGPFLNQISLGDLVTRQVRTTAIRTLNVGRPDVPRIGIRWLSSYRITLDNERREVVIERP